MPKAKNKKKRFIDPKRERTTTFALIHRSQKDPLAADSDAPQRILQPISGSENQTNEELKEIKEEERKFGVFYDDDYNYLQHLKERNEYDFDELDKFVLNKNDASEPGPPKPTAEQASAKKSGLKLPSIVFATESHEEDVGLLNKAAPHSGPLLDWDPDIVETLDDAFKHEVVYTVKDLEKDEDEDELDDLFEQALAEGNSDEEYSDDDYVDSNGEQDFSSDFGGRSEDEEDDDVPELLGDRGHLFMDEETKSRFTSYSMSSSVIRRNEQLSLLDEKFEKFYEEYDEMNVGGLEFDEIEGQRKTGIESKEEQPGDLVMKQVLDEYQKNKETERQKPTESEIKPNLETLEEGKNEKDVMEMFEDRPKDRFDCQSILSTYSTLYNHPKLISERSKKAVDPIKISGKTGMPKDVLGKGLTAGALKRLDRENAMLNGADSDDEFETQTLASRMSQLSFRNKHETIEEKKARKQAMKELKRERRVEKKANRSAFKEEKMRQEKCLLTNKQNTTKIL